MNTEKPSLKDRPGAGITAFRPTVMGTRHMVVAGHYLAAEAGFAILEAGGNAVDAGVAAGIALGVLQSDLVNFAGVAPIICNGVSTSTDMVKSFRVSIMGPPLICRASSATSLLGKYQAQQGAIIQARQPI